jgi:hypothetical protein
MNLERTTGELTFEIEGNSARIYFDRGSVTYAEIADRRMKLGEYLLSQGLITSAALERGLEVQGIRRRLGAVLVETGAIEASVLSGVIEEQIKEVVYEVVGWRAGRFRFSNGRRPKTQDVFIDIPLDHLILEGLKRLDEEGVRW